MQTHDTQDLRDSDALTTRDAMPPAEGEEEAAEIRAEIEHTRAEMSETIDAIQQKLAPEHLADQAKEAVTDVADHAREAVKEAFTEARDAVREATIGRVENVMHQANESVQGFGGTVVDTVRANPIPALLTAVGIGWLIYSSRKASTTHQYKGAYSPPRGAGYGEGYVPRGYGYGSDAYGDATTHRYYRGDQYAYGYQNERGGNPVGQFAGQAGERVSNLAGQAGETVSGFAGRAGETAGQVVGNVQETAGEFAGAVQERAGEFAGAVQERAGEWAGTVQYQARQAGDFIEHTMRENPLAIGAVALVAGAAVGMLLPVTPKENEMLGPARDNLMDRAQSMAQETIHKVQDIAEEAGNTIKREAEHQGLTR